MLRQDRKKGKKETSKKRADSSSKQLGGEEQPIDGGTSSADAALSAFNMSMLISSTGSMATRALVGDLESNGNDPSQRQTKGAEADGSPAKEKKNRKGSRDKDGMLLSSNGLDDDTFKPKKDKKGEEKESKRDKNKKEKTDKNRDEKPEKEEQAQKKGGRLLELMMAKKGGTMILRRTVRKKGTINTSISTTDLRALAAQADDLIEPPQSIHASPRVSAAMLKREGRGRTDPLSSEKPRRSSGSKKERSNSVTSADTSSMTSSTESGMESSQSEPMSSGEKPTKKKKKSKKKAKHSKKSKLREAEAEEDSADSDKGQSLSPLPKGAHTRRRSATLSALVSMLPIPPGGSPPPAQPTSAPTTPTSSPSRKSRLSAPATPKSSSSPRTPRSTQNSSTDSTAKGAPQSISTAPTLFASSTSSPSPSSLPPPVGAAIPTVATKARPSLPILNIPQELSQPPATKPREPLFPALTARPALRSGSPQTSLSPLLSPRYNRSLSISLPSPHRSMMMESNRRSQLIEPSRVRGEGFYDESGNVMFDQAVEEMIHSRWEEYESIRRIRAGSRRSNRRQKNDTNAAKLQTDANVFLGAIKEMVKMRTQLGSSGEDDQPVPDAPRRKSRRRRETEMRMKRERKSRATLRGTLRGSMTIEELRVLTNQLKSGDDGTNAEPPLLTRKSSSSSSFYIPPPPPLPPPAVVPVSAKNSTAPNEDGKWGCNILSVEHPVIYEELFTLTASQIESVAGVYRWRIESLTPVWISHLDEHHPMNHFYESDCYLILYVGRGDDDEDCEESPVKKDTSAPDRDGNFMYNLHYWIGKHASVDKKASVCIRSVQLNSYIGGKAKHYPEQQGEESALFLSYYRRSSRSQSFGSSGVRSRSGTGNNNAAESVKPSPLIYIEGGTECGLRRVKGVEPYDRPRLYRFIMPYDPELDDDNDDDNSDYLAIISGEAPSERKKKRVKRSQPYFITLVDPRLTSLNERDVFLLDTGGFQLYQWNGRLARQRLTLVCNEIVSMINVLERKSLAQIEVLSQGHTVALRHSQFWQLLYQAQRALENDSTLCETEDKRHDEEHKEPEQITNERIQALFQELLEDGAKAEGKDLSQTPTATLADGDRTEDQQDTESALGGIKEILEVRGDYGSMDLHTLWSQQDYSAALIGDIAAAERYRPSKKLLSSTGVFIIDCVSEIFVYSGRKSTPYSRQIAAFIANQMKEDDKKDANSSRPACCITHEIKEREEPVLFKARFLDWLDEQSGKWGAKEKQAPVDYRSPHQRLLDEIRKRGQLKRPQMPTIDLSALFPPAPVIIAPSSSDSMSSETIEPIIEHPIAQAEDDFLVDTSSTVEVGILLSGKSFVKLPDVEVGHFYSGECYVVLYTYVDKVKDLRKWIIYFWEGKNASSLRWPTFLLGLYPLLEEKITSSGGGTPESRRIYQGEESDDFMRIFRGTIVIRRGPRILTLEPTMEMFEAKVDPRDRFTRLISVECNAKSLSSRGAYGVFLPSGKVYIWSGKQASRQSTDALKRLIDNAAAALRNENEPNNQQAMLLHGEGAVNTSNYESNATGALAHGGMIEKGEWQINVAYVSEGNEPTDFWEALGREAVPSNSLSQNSDVSARLAKFSYEAGKFCGVEIPNFSQRDLFEACAYLLHPTSLRRDTTEADGTGAYEGKLYLWIGRQVTDALLMAARHTADRYAKHIATAQRESSIASEVNLGCSKSDDAEAQTDNKKEANRTEDQCKLAEVVEVREGDEMAEFTRFFADWTRKVFVDPYDVRMVERRRLEEIERRELEEKKRREANGEAVEETPVSPGNTGAAALSPHLDSPGSAKTSEELLADQNRKKREREEFLRKLREDRIKQDERKKQREKKEEEERKRRREKQELLRAKLKMLEQRVDLYYSGTDGETSPAGTGSDSDTTLSPHPDKDAAPPPEMSNEVQKRRDSMRAIGGLLFSSMSRSRSGSRQNLTRSDSGVAMETPSKASEKEARGKRPLASTDKNQLALERLKERQEELLSRLKTRSRFLAYEPTLRHSTDGAGGSAMENSSESESGPEEVISSG